MRIIEKRRGYFLGTHKGAMIEIEGDRGRFYIRVRGEKGEGSHLYDGPAPDGVTTMKQAKTEAIRGAMLDKAKK